MSEVPTTTITGKRKTKLDRQASILGATKLDDEEKKASLADFAIKQLNHPPTDKEINDYLDLASTKQKLRLS